MQHHYRIVVGFDTKSETGHAAAAAHLARALGADLAGIFVEELEALRLASLPFAVLVERTGRTVELDPQRLEALMRAAAERIERELSEAARRERVEVSFQVARGRFYGELRSAAAPRDVIVVGSGGPAQRPAPKRGSIAVIVDAPEHASRLLDLAAAIAGEDEPIVVLAAPTARPAIAGWKPAAPRRVLVRPIELARPLQIRQAMDRLHGRMLLLSSSALDERALDELRRELSCPLVIV